MYYGRWLTVVHLAGPQLSDYVERDGGTGSAQGQIQAAHPSQTPPTPPFSKTHTPCVYPTK